MKFYTYFSNQQRLAIIVLILGILALQFSWVFHKESQTDTFDIPLETYLKFQKEVDSLIAEQRHSSAPKIYPFNPNYITDYKGYTLGMTAKEIDRLHAYRANNKWVNTAKEFQRVTKVSDLLLKRIVPYFKFPDWVTKSTVNSSVSEKSFVQKLDLNKVTAKQLQKVHGIGAFYSERIVRYRDSFEGGFISDLQLQGIKGLTPEVIANILKEFTVKTPRIIEKIDLNSVTIEQLVSIEYIDYELAYEIIELRMLRDGYNAIEELTKVKGFPKEKLEIIKLYLSLN